MADNISALLGMGLQPQDNMNALADSLRGEQRMGDYYSQSTLAPIAQLGKTMQNRSASAANRGGILKQAIQKQKQAQENWEADGLAKVKAAQKIADANASKRDTKTYWHPTLPDTALNLREGPDGKHYDQTGQAYNPELLTPYRAGQDGSIQRLSKAQVKDQNQKEKKLEGRDFVSKTLTSPHMAGATGSLIASLGTNLNSLIGTNPKVGSLQTDLSNMTVQQAAEPLSYLGVNPTDKDLSFALEATRTLGSQPESWRDWYRDIYTPEITRAILSDKALTDTEKQEITEKWQEMSNDTIKEMEQNITLESEKPAMQRLKETWDEDKTEQYKKESAENITPTEGWGKVRVD